MQISQLKLASLQLRRGVNIPVKRPINHLVKSYFFHPIDFLHKDFLGMGDPEKNYAIHDGTKVLGYNINGRFYNLSKIYEG